MKSWLIGFQLVHCPKFIVASGSSELNHLTDVLIAENPVFQQLWLHSQLLNMIRLIKPCGMKAPELALPATMIAQPIVEHDKINQTLWYESTWISCVCVTKERGKKNCCHNEIQCFKGELHLLSAVPAAAWCCYFVTAATVHNKTICTKLPQLAHIDDLI